MQPLTRLDGVGVPMPGSDVDTDQIVPARFMHARRVDYGRYFFHDLRFDPASGAERPSFVLNRPGYRGAEILVTGPNFGCGSSREQAVHTLADFGIRALIGTSFGDIFFNNCLKNGVLPIRAPQDFVDPLLATLDAKPGARIRVDLPAQQVVTPDKAVLQFAIDPFQKEALVGGLEEIDVTLRLEDAITAFERAGGVDAAAIRGSVQ